jgi:Skp family chaperone for outer membrane proteins
MTRTSKILIAAAVSVGAMGWAATALAQAARPAAVAPRPAAPPAAAAPRPTIPQGPPIAGLCIYSNDYTVGASAVGKFVSQRLQQLQQQVQAELSAEQTALQTDAKAFDAARATLSTEVQQQRLLSLQQRDAALQRKAEQRDKELQATAQKAIGRVVSEANPLLQQVYAQHTCSVLLDGQAVMGSNPAMNITPDVVRLLDAKITQFAFEREHLDQAAAPAGAQRSQR